MTKTVRFAAALLIGVLTALPIIARAQAENDPANSIETVGVAKQGGDLVVRIGLKRALTAVPGSFSVANPARIAIDFPGTTNATGKSSVVFNEGDLRSANVVQAGDRSRLVLNLVRPMSYQAAIDGKSLVVTLSGSQGSQTTAGGPKFAQASAKAGTHAIRDIGFRRGRDGEGRIVVDLSDPGVGIDIRNQGNTLVVEFAKASLPEHLRKRLDVSDFATPVTSIVTSPSGQNVRMVVSPKGNWEHNAYQSESQFVLEVKTIPEDTKKLVDGKQKFSGEKLSLNFQNIDVRSVLQVIADFTNFNIITSDSVTGALTLRLKDVPWDQALDIILQAKGLDMRKNGNVIWIAPRDELAQREKVEFESKQAINDLEPVRTETFQINYHRATSVAAFLKSKDNTILSKRGSVVVDDRTNKLFISDIGSRLDDIRRVVTEIDVPVRQVLIEAQIVEAADTFTRNLGVRMGLGANGGGVVGTTSDGRSVARNNFGGGLGQTAYQGGLTDTKPDFLEAAAVNLPAGSIAGAAAGALSFVLWNSNATRFLALEISALEADGKGKVISRPKVMTADQVEAIIEQGVEIPYQQATSSGATSVSFKKANLSLRVKPQITPDGKILMSLDVNKDTPNTRISTSGGIAIDTKHVKTEVLVENGGTVVIGGIYQQETNNRTTKIPFLGDLPVAGYLFRDNSRTDDKTELLVFITPRILSEQTASR